MVQLTAVTVQRQGEAVTVRLQTGRTPTYAAMVLDDGPCRYGQPSSVVRVKNNHFEMLREGVVGEATLRRLAGVIGTRGLVRIVSPIGLRLSRIDGGGRPVRIVLYVARLLAGVIGSLGLVPIVSIVSHIGLRLSRIDRSRRHVRIILHVARRLAGVVVGSTRPVGIIVIIPLLLPLTIPLVVLPLAGPVIALAVLRRTGGGRTRA